MLEMVLEEGGAMDTLKCLACFFKDRILLWSPGWLQTHKSHATPLSQSPK